MRWRAEETGESERRSVIERIEVLPHCESGLTSSWSLVTRKPEEPLQMGIANERGLIHVCTHRLSVTEPSSSGLGTRGQSASSVSRAASSSRKVGGLKMDHDFG